MIIYDAEKKRRAQQVIFFDKDRPIQAGLTLNIQSGQSLLINRVFRNTLKIYVAEMAEVVPIAFILFKQLREA